ncbi:hypothetical protein AB0J38_14410 [Streptomyces sp. NPDC050095]|uniref:hypothetical protein n=1 Tax=unclassified Streptomyces TaxID=2593676 RepID=UPI003426D9B7
MARSLGCANEYLVVLNYRGGPQNGIAAIVERPAVIKWQRILDAISVCAITLAKPLCGSLTRALNPTLVQDPEWAYEITIYRDQDTEPVWCGPLVTYTETRSTITLGGADLLAWLKMRPIPVDYRYTGKSSLDASELAAWVMNEAYALDDPLARANIITTPAGMPASRRGQAWTEVAWDAINALVAAHIDLTCVRRTILIGPEQHSVLGRVLRLTEDDFTGDEGPTIERDGYTAATMFTAKAQGLQGVAADPNAVSPTDSNWVDIHAIKKDGEDGTPEFTQPDLTPTASAVQAQTPPNVATVGGTEEGWRGLLWQLRSMQGTRLIDEVTLTAQRGLRRGRHPHYLRMSASQLHPKAPVPIEDLIPGARVRLDLDETWVRPLNTPMRLTNVDVTFDKNGETVTIACEPVSINVEDPTDEEQELPDDQEEALSGTR